MLFKTSVHKRAATTPEAIRGAVEDLFAQVESARPEGARVIIRHFAASTEGPKCHGDLTAACANGTCEHPQERECHINASIGLVIDTGEEGE